MAVAGLSIFASKKYKAARLLPSLKKHGCSLLIQVVSNCRLGSPLRLVMFSSSHTDNFQFNL